MKRRAVVSLGSLAIGIATYVSSGLFVVPDRLKDLQIESPLEQQIEQEYNIQIVGNTTESAVRALDRAFATLDSTANLDDYLENTKTINLDPISPFIKRKKTSGTAIMPMKIVNLNVIRADILAHEFAHIHHYHLPDKQEFEEAWEKISQIEYRPKVSNTLIAGKQNTWAETGNSLPNHGLIDTEAATDINEDIAYLREYVHKAYKYALGDKKYQNKPKPIPEDKRYLQKLDLLDAFGFLHPGEADAVRPYLDPSNPLSQTEKHQSRSQANSE